jgi:hypothetical protein
MSTTAGSSADHRAAPPGRFASLAQRRPITTFLIWALGIGWPLLTVPIAAGVEASPFLILLVFVALLAPALVITRATGGRGAVRALLARVLVWRFSVTRWAVILLGVPVLTIVVAALSGTLETPDDGWVTEAGTYLFATLVFPMLLINLWEETAWAGFVPHRQPRARGDTQSGGLKSPQALSTPGGPDGQRTGRLAKSDVTGELNGKARSPRGGGYADRRMQWASESPEEAAWTSHPSWTNRTQLEPCSNASGTTSGSRSVRSARNSDEGFSRWSLRESS